MKKIVLPLLLCLLSASGNLFAAGPFDPDVWPSVADSNKVVHFISTDGAFTPLGANWSSTLNILTGGDQITEPITLQGRTGKKVIGTYLNTADSGFRSEEG